MELKFFVSLKSDFVEVPSHVCAINWNAFENLGPREVVFFEKKSLVCTEELKLNRSRTKKQWHSLIKWLKSVNLRWYIFCVFVL